MYVYRRHYITLQSFCLDIKGCILYLLKFFPALMEILWTIDSPLERLNTWAT